MAEDAYTWKDGRGRFNRMDKSIDVEHKILNEKETAPRK